MKKKHILQRIQEEISRGIKNPNLGGDPVGLKITKQALKKSKEENEAYYKELDKKFEKYLKLDVKDNPSPKVNMDDKDREMYYGSGMEGLKYDDEGTERYKKFVDRNKELNKPSKDYYLKKDQVSDSYDKIVKDGNNYKKHKYEKPDEYQKTPKVRVTNESTNKKTMKLLNYKKPFLSHERAMNLIPESYKTNGNKFKMTDGVETYTVKWEGDSKGKATVLTYKNTKLVKEDVNKMKHLYGYKSEETLMKTNDALTENQIFKELLNKSRILVKEQTAPAPATGTKPTDGTKPAATDPNASTPKATLPVSKPYFIGENNKVRIDIQAYVVLNNKKYEISNLSMNFPKGDLMRSGVNSLPPMEDHDKYVDAVNANSKKYLGAEFYNLNLSKSTDLSAYEALNTYITEFNLKQYPDPKGLLEKLISYTKNLPHTYTEVGTGTPKEIEIPNTFGNLKLTLKPNNIVNKIDSSKTCSKATTYDLNVGGSPLKNQLIDKDQCKTTWENINKVKEIKKLKIGNIINKYNNAVSDGNGWYSYVKDLSRENSCK